MTAVNISIWVLLGVGAITFIFMSVALITIQDFYEKLHYLAPAATIGITAFAAAIVIQESLSQAGIKAILVALLLAVTSPVLAHATARAGRLQHKKQWPPAPGEPISEDHS